MSFVTIPAEYSKWIVKPLEKVEGTPSRVMVTFEYTENPDEDPIFKQAMKDYRDWKNIYDKTDLDNLMKKRWIIK